MTYHDCIVYQLRKEKKMKDKNEILTMTGEQALKHVTALKRNPKLLKVYIKYTAFMTHVERKEIGETGEAIDDVYGGKEFSIPSVSIDLTWKQFVEFCEEADRFSKLKQERFDEVGDDDSSAEFGTGVSIGTSYNLDYHYAIVTVDR